MAAAAPSPLASSVEKTNGAKLSRLLIDGGTTVLRKVFDRHHPPANLVADLNACYSILNNLLRRRILKRHQWDQLFPPGGAVPDSNTFDITLLFLLLTNISGLSPPLTGWHTKPPPSDTSHEANLSRVKFYRNVLYGHVSTTGVDTPTFSALWQKISVVLVALGLDQAEIDRLKGEKGGEQDYLDALFEWADSEEDIKAQLINICQIQSKTQHTVDIVRQTQMEDHETLQDSNSKLEEVRRTQNKTQQTVEKVCQTQAKTQQTVEKVHQTQSKTQQTIEEVAAGLQNVKETVDSLKQGRISDKADEVLRNLAKSEFIGDIEYYVERFQEDTREWVFNKVQNWLDDRSSQNRVMVISANAGMGKSVIAAVICKRMQQAGGLSGSHFCQHNNVRYRNPQLMLQSLACHLSHALPEYRQALVEQLSRNLGGDLNNMGVGELFALLFKEPLSTVGDPGRNMLMVIDGLDESEYQGRNELLDVIANQFCKLPSWIRFLVTTRPAMNISGKLQRLKPFELQSIDEKNLEDIRTLFKEKLRHDTKTENVDALVEKLVLKSEGLMLYAHFLILFIQEDASVLDQIILDSSLPLGISSVYHSYFKRLESELIKELDIKEKRFLNLLCAITASREPLPIDFVSKLLVPSRNSPLAKRKVLKAIRSVSSLLPIRDGFLHVIHKSVKDWLTDISCYGEHEFIVDENEGHRVLADLCTGELDDLKRRGVHNPQLSAAEEYSLDHGARHMLQLERGEWRPRKLEELAKAYVVDLELIYAKLCVNNTMAAEDLLWLQKQEISVALSKESRCVLNTLLFLLRKYRNVFSSHPRVFFQNVLNEGGSILSAEASKLLQNKYMEIPYMEYIHKETQKGRVLAEFQCSCNVACFDVSPELDYMVCECTDGILQLWSLRTGRLVWEHPVIVPKSYPVMSGAYRKKPSSPVLSFYRSVVFHPTECVVLPGILSHAYTIDGDLKPLFTESTCRFSVCSICGDKTKLLTDCPNDAKCLVMWSLRNGSEIARITRDEDVLTFACSADGKLLAISHITGLICLVDVMNGFTTLAETATPQAYGMLKFSPDNRGFVCLRSYGLLVLGHCQYLFIVNSKHHTLSLVASSDDVSCDPRECESLSDCGFLLGDPIPFPISVQRFDIELNFVLNKETELSGSPFSKDIQMLNTNQVTRKSQDTTTKGKKIALSLDGQTVYCVIDAAVPRVMAWDVFSGKLIAKKTVERDIFTSIYFSICLVPVREGVIFTTPTGILELWNFDMSVRLQKWTLLPRTIWWSHIFGTNLSRITEVIPVTEERVACITEDGGFEVAINIQDLTREKIVSTNTIPSFSPFLFSHGRVVTCNSKLQIVTVSDDSPPLLHLTDGTFQVWKNSLSLSDYYSVRGMFSPTEQSVVIWTQCYNEPAYVLDAVSGNTLHALNGDVAVGDVKFVSDEECVFSCGAHSSYHLRLFNVRSGHLLSVIDVESLVSCLGACPRKRLIAIGHRDSTPVFKVLRVWLPRDKTTGKTKGVCR